jgi:hypothetical protein
MELEKMATKVATIKGLIKYVKALYNKGASFRCIDKFVYMVQDIHKNEPQFDVMWLCVPRQCLGRQAHNGSYYGYSVYDWLLLPIVDGGTNISNCYICFENAETDYDRVEEEAIISYQDTYYW